MKIMQYATSKDILATDYTEEIRISYPCNLWLTALLLAHLFVGGSAFEVNTAVCRHCFDHCSTGAEVQAICLLIRPCNSYRKINTHASVDCSCLQVSRVILGH